MRNLLLEICYVRLIIINILLEIYYQSQHLRILLIISSTASKLHLKVIQCVKYTIELNYINGNKITYIFVLVYLYNWQVVFSWIFRKRYSGYSKNTQYQEINFFFTSPNTFLQKLDLQKKVHGKITFIKSIYCSQTVIFDLSNTGILRISVT